MQGVGAVADLGPACRPQGPPGEEPHLHPDRSQGPGASTNLEDKMSFVSCPKKFIVFYFLNNVSSFENKDLYFSLLHCFPVAAVWARPLHVVFPRTWAHLRSVW